MKIHFTGEGEVDFKSLLYIPASAPANMFDPNNAESRRNIKLYVKRVFITGKWDAVIVAAEKFWFRFFGFTTTTSLCVQDVGVVKPKKLKIPCGIFNFIGFTTPTSLWF